VKKPGNGSHSRVLPWDLANWWARRDGVQAARNLRLAVSGSLRKAGCLIQLLTSRRSRSTRTAVTCGHNVWSIPNRMQQTTRPEPTHKNRVPGFTLHGTYQSCTRYSSHVRSLHLRAPSLRISFTIYNVCETDSQLLYCLDPVCKSHYHFFISMPTQPNESWFRRKRFTNTTSGLRLYSPPRPAESADVAPPRERWRPGRPARARTGAPA